MSKSEICRAIAEKLEPNPCPMPPPLYFQSCSHWWWFEHGIAKPYNFFTDESASARLRTAIRKQFKYVAACYQRQGETVNTDQIEFEFSESIDGNVGLCWIYKGFDELEAWALVAANWLGIEVGELTN